jgi:hypothetical protein
MAVELFSRAGRFRSRPCGEGRSVRAAALDSDLDGAFGAPVVGFAMGRLENFSLFSP